MGALSNPRHERFAQEIVAGHTQREAYRAAFPKSQNWQDRSVDVRGSKLANLPAIKERIQELNEEASIDAVLKRTEKMLILTDIAKNEEQTSKSRMQAIDLLNKMSGDYVKKVEAFVRTDMSETASMIADILSETD